MRFAADAHISLEMVRMIRELGHDCLDGSSIPLRMPDVDVLRAAAADDRVVVTADKDFGELVFLHRIACPGVILIRLGGAEEAGRVARVRVVWPDVVGALPGSFVMIGEHHVRVRPLGELD
jgi:predicted nuclease of predicted toxin-antitoxin system